MIILRQKKYSGSGTRFIYNTLRKGGVNGDKAKRIAIRIKRPLEKVGHAVADRAATTAVIAGPGMPIPFASWAVAGGYAISPGTVKAVPGLGKYVGAIENSKLSRGVAKSIHKGVDGLFKIGKH